MSRVGHGIAVLAAVGLATAVARPVASDNGCQMARMLAVPSALTQAKRLDPQSWGRWFDAMISPPDVRALAQRCEEGAPGFGQVVCRWDFPLGDPGALAHLERIEMLLSRCLAGAATLERDTGVNHPDIFIASSFDLPLHRLTHSVKNKSALGQTFVTFRLFERN